MNATFNPISGFSIEFKYDRADLSQAIAAQVSLWVYSLASRFLGLCETTVSGGHQARAQVNGKVTQAHEVGRKSLREAAEQAQVLGVELAIATLRRIKRPILGLISPPLNTIFEHYLGVRNTVQSALSAYIEGATEPTLLSLPSGEAALEEQELLVPKSDEAIDKAIADAESTHSVAQKEEESQSVLQLSNERPEALEGDHEKGEDTIELRPKRRGRGRSA